MKEETNEEVNTLLLYYVSQKVIPTFQIGKRLLEEASQMW